MTAKEPINPNAYEPADELVLDAEFDPLAETDAEGAGEGGGCCPPEDDDMGRSQAPDEEDVLPYLGDPAADHLPEVKVDDRPASVRIAELFDRMKPRRKVLLGVLAQCREPVEVDAVHERVDALQADRQSVFDGPALCALLERAGAIEKVADGRQQPQVVVVDGVEYLEPAREVAVRYRATDDGLAYLEADKPCERLQAAFEKEALYKPIFLRILKACGEEGGKSAKELGALVDSDPLLQSPRFWAAHFFNILGECDALAWNGTWKTTDLGRKAAEELELEGVEA